ncbi:deoxyribose-phosphate aldolase [Ilyonectria robusta]
MAPLSVNELAKMIDHSIIDPYHTENDLINGIQLAKKYQTGQFVTQPFRVKQARQLLQGTSINLQTFIGLPHGGDRSEVKVFAAKNALEGGAQELDMVINISALLSGDMGYVEKEVKTVVDTAKVRAYCIINRKVTDSQSDRKYRPDLEEPAGNRIALLEWMILEFAMSQVRGLLVSGSICWMIEPPAPKLSSSTRSLSITVTLYGSSTPYVDSPVLHASQQAANACL